MPCLSNSEVADKSDCVCMPEEILMQKYIQIQLRIQIEYDNVSR